MLKVLRTPGFLAFLTLAFLNAFVDLGHKIMIQNTIFKTDTGTEQIVLTAIVNGLILLPFILMFSPAGFLSDKYPKPHIMRISAWVAVGLTLLITLSYYMGWFWFAFGMTFLLALQSAFYSPAKYGYIKELLGEKKLAAGNALIQSMTMIAILLATFFFSILFEMLYQNLPSQLTPNKAQILENIAVLGWALVGLSLLEVYCAYRTPITKAQQALHFDWRDFYTGKSSAADIKLIWDRPIIWMSIMGLSVFWALSQVVLATYPAFLKEHLAVDNTAVVQGLMACAGIGIMLGSLIAGRLSKEAIATHLVPVGAIGVFITVTLITVLESQLLQAINFILLGVMGGLFVVPLNSLMQYHAESEHLGRILASNNLVQNVAMLSFLIMTIVLTSLGLTSIGLFYVLAVVALMGAIYTLYTRSLSKSAKMP